MSDAMTLPSDLFVPQVALQYARVKFVTSLQAMRFLGMGMDAPVRLVNFGNLFAGGQFVKAPTLSRISSLESQRDLTSESLVDTLKFGSREDDGVLLNRKIGPAAYTMSGEQLSGLRPGMLEVWFAEQAVRSMLETIQGAVIAAAKGAVSAVTSTAHTYSSYVASGTKSNLDTEELAHIKAKLGDAQDRLMAWIFRSETLKDLGITQLGAGVQGIADRVAGGGNPLTLGRDFAVVDDSNLYTADASYDYWYTLGLCPGAIEVEFTRALDIPMPQVELRSENRQIIMRGDYDFAVRVPGFAFDSGTTNPTLTNLATSAKWTYNAADHREVGIVLGEHNASAS